MIRAQPAEFAPITAAWSSAVQARPCRRGEAEPDLVPPDLGVHEHPVEVEDDRVDAGHVGLGGGSCGIGGSAATASGPPSRAVGRTRAGPVDRVVDGLDELGDVVGGVVLAAQEVAFELEVEQPMAALDLDRQLADLEAVPADEPARTPAAPRPAR